MAVIPPFNPQERIPNNPFNNPEADRYTLYTVTGTPLTFGSNFFVDYRTGQITVAPNPPNNGTVYQITVGPGLISAPSGGIVTTGSVDLDSIPTLTPGSYTYPIISVNGNGHLTLAANGPTPLTTLIGTAPILVSGTGNIRNIGISGATVSAKGAVQLIDSLSSNDGTRALTALQGYNLGSQMQYIGGQLAGQYLAGIVSTTTGNITQLTLEAIALGGLVVGSPVPAPPYTPLDKYDGAFFILQGADATYNVPGGSPVSAVNNDRIVCVEGTWQFLECGTRLASASSGAAGLTILATSTEVQALTEPNKSVTPGSLAVMVASDTQVGFVELATDAETLAFTDATRAITSSNLDKVCATTATRGIVRLTDSIADPSVITAPTANALKKYSDSSLDAATITAQGDLIVGQSIATPAILPLGTQASLLVVDDTKPLGIDWDIPDSQTTWPVGSITWYLASVAPALWVPCDGSMYDGSISGPYFQLYDVVGITFNTGSEPAGFFRVPDLRGVFIRGWDAAGGTARALDPGRIWGSRQGDAYQQHNHGVTDPGHVMPFPLCTHDHAKTDPGHVHGKTDPGHYHCLNNWSVSEVVGNTPSWYDSVGSSFGKPQTTTQKTGISIDPGVTNFTLASKQSSLTVQTCTTGLTVDNAPPTAPSPDESRPNNRALLPMIKYANF
jgi:hypothetical protein